MNTRISRITSHPAWARAKVVALSVAALAAFAATVTERHRIDSLVASGRDKVSRMMRLEQIDWVEVGVSNLSSRVSRELLMKTSGLAMGQEMLPIDLGDLESKLMSVPWVESVQIQKKLPSTLLVRYTVHNAKAIGLRHGRPWSISDSGHWIAPLDGRVVARSSARGGTPPSTNAALDLPVLGNEDELAAELRWLDAIESSLGGPLVQIHQIDMAPIGGRGARSLPITTSLVEIQYASQTAKLTIIGNELPSDDGLNRLNQVVHYLIKNNILVSKIDLRLGKKVVVNVGKRP